MAGYLDRIGAGLVLKDIEPLSFDYIPVSLVESFYKNTLKLG